MHRGVGWPGCCGCVKEKEEVVHKEISRGLLILGWGGVAGEGTRCPQNPQKLLIFQVGWIGSIFLV